MMMKVFYMEVSNLITLQKVIHIYPFYTIIVQMTFYKIFSDNYRV